MVMGSALQGLQSSAPATKSARQDSHHAKASRMACAICILSAPVDRQIPGWLASPGALKIKGLPRKDRQVENARGTTTRAQPRRASARAQQTLRAGAIESK